MCYAFCKFLFSKIAAIATKIHCILASAMLSTRVPLNQSMPTWFTGFSDVSDAEAFHMTQSIPVKTTAIDFISASISKGACDEFEPLIAMLANLSFSQGKFPTMFKIVQVTLLPKKPGISPKSKTRSEKFSSIW